MSKTLLGLNQVFISQDTFARREELLVVGNNMIQMFLDGLFVRSNGWVSSIRQSHHLWMDNLAWRLDANLNGGRLGCLRTGSLA